MGWLEWVGWGGISGVVSLVALVAALLVTYIEARSWWLSPRGVDVDLRISRVSERSDAIQLVFGLRVIGVRTLHEVSIRRIGGGGGSEKLGSTVGVLEARDGEIERATWVLRDSPPVYFIVTWHEPTRFGYRMQAIRMGFPHDRGLERWKPYRWPFFPRKADGIWVQDRSHSGARGKRGIFWPVEDAPRR